MFANSPILKELEALTQVDKRQIFSQMLDHLEGMNLLAMNLHDALMSLLRNEDQSMLLVNAALRQYEMFYSFSEGVLNE
jgi:hypothetical protein